MGKCVTPPWTPEEDKFLADNIKTAESIKALLEMHNKQFPVQRTYLAVKKRLHRFGLKNGKVPVKGCVARNSSPIGHIIKDCHGRLWIKVKSSPTGRKMNCTKQIRINHVRLDRYNWEKENPPLKDGEWLYHLDGNQENCDISNLRVVNRYIHSCMTLDKLHKMESADIQNCAIDYEYLKSAIKETKK